MARRRSVPIFAGSACVNAWTESLPWSKPAWVRSISRSRSNSATALITLIVSLPVELARSTPPVPGSAPARRGRRGECQKPGALRRELDGWVAKPPVQHRGPDLKHSVGAAGRPAHLLSLVHAGAHQLIDGAFGPRGRDRLASPVALAVVDQRALVALDIGAQRRATRDQAPRPSFHCGVVQHDGVLGPARNPAQGLARLLVMPIPARLCPFGVSWVRHDRDHGA